MATIGLTLLLLVSHQVVSSSFVTPWTVARLAPPVHGISQARPLEWVAISYSRDVCDLGIETVSCIAGGFFNTEPLRKPRMYIYSFISGFIYSVINLFGHVDTNMYCI